MGGTRKSWDDAELTTTLRGMTVAELRELAREQGVNGVGQLRKDVLVDELLAIHRRGPAAGEQQQGDHLSVEVAGRYWLGLDWNITQKTYARAVASLAQDWHRAERVLRVYSVDWDDSGPHARQHHHDEKVPEEATRWYVQIDGKSQGWKFEIGYLVSGGKFFSLLHSADFKVEPVRTNQFANSSRGAEELLSRSPLESTQQLTLEVDGSVMLKGKTLSGATATVDDDEVGVHAKTGQFSWSTPLQSGRVVIPVVSELGNQRIRAVLSIESSIHYLEAEKTGP